MTQRCCHDSWSARSLCRAFLHPQRVVEIRGKMKEENEFLTFKSFATNVLVSGNLHYAEK